MTGSSQSKSPTSTSSSTRVLKSHEDRGKMGKTAQPHRLAPPGTSMGLLLWLLQRPALRWVPVPYPSVSSVELWKAHTDNMVINGSLAKRHLTRAKQVGAFNDATHLRNRLGFEMAFMEDPLLAGMLAARSARGVSHRIRAIALQEATAEAKKSKDSGRQQAAVRELVGPAEVCQLSVKICSSWPRFST